MLLTFLADACVLFISSIRSSINAISVSTRSSFSCNISRYCSSERAWTGTHFDFAIRFNKLFDICSPCSSASVCWLSSFSYITCPKYPRPDKTVAAGNTLARPPFYIVSFYRSKPIALTDDPLNTSAEVAPAKPPPTALAYRKLRWFVASPAWESMYVRRTAVSSYGK